MLWFHQSQLQPHFVWRLACGEPVMSQLVCVRVVVTPGWACESAELDAGAKTSLWGWVPVSLKRLGAVGIVAAEAQRTVDRMPSDGPRHRSSTDA